MATTPLFAPGEDLSALSWVSGELQRSLDSAHKALRRFLREAQAIGPSDVDSADPAILRGARVQLHQSVGALELVGLSGAAKVLRASEAAVQRMMGKPELLNAGAVDAIEAASFAVIDYLQRLLQQRPVSPVALFPQYRAVQELAGGDRIHPADLWGQSWHWEELPGEPGVTPWHADDRARDHLESLVLQLMRRPDAAAMQRLSDFCAQLAEGARSTLAATTWRLAAAFFDAQGEGLLDSDVFAKRMASRLLAQLRANVRSDDEVSERLAIDLLFFCARARTPAPGRAPRLQAVRQAWQLGDTSTSTDYAQAKLGRYDPATLAQARKRVASAKEVWSAVTGGELRRLPTLNEPFALLADTLVRLVPQGQLLADALQGAARQTSSSGEAPGNALAMEMATAVLWLDAAFEAAEFDAPELGQRVQRVAERVEQARLGGEVLPLEPWIEELYRRYSDQQTMGSVVHELRASLSEVEKQIDQFFRDPSQRDVLLPVPQQLSAMRGVLSVLDLEQASLAVLHMRQNVDDLAATEVDPVLAAQAGTFDRLADNLGALGFLIDMLSVQPQLARTLFRFDADTGRLLAEADLGHRAVVVASDAPLADEAQSLAQALIAGNLSDEEVARQLESLGQRAVVADQTALARVAAQGQQALQSSSDGAERQAVREELTQAMQQLAAPVAPVEITAVPPMTPRPEMPPTAPGETGLEEDAEMREIFIEEAREVIEGARQALQRLTANGENVADLTAVRRAFHTLKGSARMVGLREFGEAAWACEQVYNDRLARDPRSDPQLHDFSMVALDLLSPWVDAIEAGHTRGFSSADLAARALALREGTAEAPGVAAGLPVAGTLPALDPAVESLRARVPDLPSAADLDLPASVSTLVPGGDAPSLDFALDLGEFDAAPTAEAALPVASVVAVDAADLAEFGSFGSDIHIDLPAVAADAPPLPELALDDAPTAPLPGASLDQPPVAAATELEGGVDFAIDLPDLADPVPEPAPEPTPVPAVELAPDLVPEPVDESAAALPAEFQFTPTLPALDAEPERVATAVGAAAVLAAAAATAAAAVPATPAPALEPLDDRADADAARAEAVDDDQTKLIGDLRIPIALFNIFLNEADEQSRRLVTELAEWAVEHRQRAVPETAIALAHSLAGNSATVGYASLSQLARALEHALMRSQDLGVGRDGEPELFNDAAEEVRRLLHQFAAGFLKPVNPLLLQQLADHERWPRIAPTVLPVTGELADALPVEDEPEAEPAAVETAATSEPAATIQTPLPAPPPMPELGVGSVPGQDEDDDAIDAVDVIDDELLPVFLEEADELLPQLQADMRQWLAGPADRAAAEACMRSLHTFKGGARLAGAMRLGEMAHRMETGIEHRLARGQVGIHDLEPLMLRLDRIVAGVDALRDAPVVPVASAPAPAPTPATAPEPAAVPEYASAVAAAAVLAAAAQAAAANAQEAAGGVAPAAGEAAAEIDWSRFSLAPPEAPAAVVGSGPGGVVRVRSGLLDRLVNGAGEVSIARARIESDVRQLQGSLGDLTESLERMRRELRDIELQAETQISARIEAAKASSQAFDPLEMDRFTRLQELTRMMAESVNDVATLQRGLQRTLQSTEDQLAAQSRQTRELQEDLLRTRMVEFESLAERLYRVVRQAAKDDGKQVRLDIVGGSIEVDRGVLERMIGPFEHMLRNSVVHGIEPPAVREAAGKSASGNITVRVTHTANEVSVEFSDDGAGLDLPRILQRARERGLVADDARPSDGELSQMIFLPGFSTATAVTELAGRGIGMDVVRAEVTAMGGRIETHTEAGRGTRFSLVLPLTTAVTQVVMLRAGPTLAAVPSTLVELVRRVPTAEVEAAYASGSMRHGDEEISLYWLASLLEGEPPPPLQGRTQAVVVVRSAAQRVAVLVDEVQGNQEVVVKHLGPQLSRMPGLTGVTLLPSGAVALIYNPVALAALYGPRLLAQQQRPVEAGRADVAPPEPELAPLVMVVDDSLTVRRVTQRLLEREGYRVLLAKDGVEALERLAQAEPVVILCDIEMPRMDGFELVRSLRADSQRSAIPVIMITSRIAQKHRDHAAQLGVRHYLGKPYAEAELLALVAQYAGRHADVLAVLPYS